MTVGVTDVASGERGEFVVPYFGWFDITDSYGRRVPYADPEFRTTLTLGGNRYAFAAASEQVTVLVTPGGVAETPEPATLALAGLGLLAVGVRRRRG